MVDKLKFLPSALKEWDKLDNTIKEQLKKKLKERLNNPYVAGDEIRGFKNYYKIKLRSVGYRLIYEVIEQEAILIVIAVNRRDKIYQNFK